MRTLHRSSYVALILTVTIASACRSKQDEFAEFQAAKQRQLDVIDDEALEARTKLNAVHDWTRTEWKYTANVRSALVRQDGRPVFFSGRVRDIDVLSGRRIVTIDVEAWVPGAVRFRLDCDGVQLLLEQRAETRVVGVANLEQLQVTRESEQPGMAAFNRRFLATGRCVYVKGIH